MEITPLTFSVHSTHLDKTRGGYNETADFFSGIFFGSYFILPGVLDKTTKISRFYLTKVCVANFFINNNFSFHCEVVIKSQIGN